MKIQKIVCEVVSFLLPLLLLAQSQNWVYRYNGPGNAEDWASPICYGSDGNIYAAGFSSGSGTDFDFTVISLNPQTGIEEYSSLSSSSNFEFTPTFFNQKITLRFVNSSTTPIKITLYNALGAMVYETSFSSTCRFLVLDDIAISKLPQSIYFLRLKSSDEIVLRKLCKLK
jgi:hypothetical protein